MKVHNRDTDTFEEVDEKEFQASLDAEKAKSLKSETEEEEEEEEKSDKEEEKDDSKKSESEEEEEKRDDKSEEEEEEKSDKEEEEKKESTEKKEESPLDIDTEIKNRFGEEYEINSIEELEQILENTQKLLDENEELKEKVEAAAQPREPEFANEAQKSAFNFIKNYDPEQQGDALESWAKLVKMDVDKADPRMVLEEHFVQAHPELTRQQAMRKFSRDYERKYVPKQEDFDDDNKFAVAKEDADIDLTADVAAAKKALKAKQKEIQYTPTDKKEDSTPKKNEDVERSIERYAKEFDEYQKDFDSIIFAPSDKEDDNFQAKFTKDQVKAIKTLTKTWVSNPANYDEKGKLRYELNPEEATKKAAFTLFGDEMFAKMWEHAVQALSIKRADEIGRKKPDRESKVSTASAKELSVDDQWGLHAQRKQKSA